MGQLVNQTRKVLNSKSDPARDCEAKIARLLQLRTLLNSFPALRSALRKANSTLLQNIAAVLTDDRTDEMLEIMSATINEDCEGALKKGSLAARNTRIYAIRAERKLLLDVARETCGSSVPPR